MQITVLIFDIKLEFKDLIYLIFTGLMIRQKFLPHFIPSQIFLTSY